MSLRILTDQESKQIQRDTVAKLHRESFITNSHGKIDQVMLIVNTNGIDLQVIDFSDAETMSLALAKLPKKTWTPTPHDCINIIKNSATNAQQLYVEQRCDQLWDYLKKNKKSMIADQKCSNNKSVAVFRTSDDSVTHMCGDYDMLEKMFPKKRGENLVLCLVADD